MYFPYLRGRQFELIGIRELLDNDILTDKVIPVIEPITISSTLISTLELFIKKNRKIALIFNPEVGSFQNELNKVAETGNETYKRLSLILNNRLVLKTLLLNQQCVNILENWKNENIFDRDVIFIYNENEDILEIDKYKIENYKYIFIPDERSFRRKFNANKVLFADRFVKKNKNSDYSEQEEFFSDDFPFFQNEGYAGFSDFSVVGNYFSSEGFTPYAVVIHIVYFNEKQDKLNIRHFVSDSNDSPKDPARKYYEALNKLNTWWLELPDEIKELNKSMALDTFLYHFKTQSYSGLGIIKKLSIMHHLELIGRYLKDSVK
jgi:hypothetical protein